MKDKFSGFSHLLGAILSIFGLFMLILKSLPLGVIAVFACTVFGLSQILLYSASSTYHLIKASPKTTLRLRKLDHSMIFILIAGTYTPICLITLANTLGYVLLGAVWIIALFGILLKIFLFNSPRILSTGSYVLMGWLIAIATFQLKDIWGFWPFFFLISSGLFYSIGSIIYAFKFPFRNGKHFNFHDLFHLFILLGSLSFFILIYVYVI